MVYRPLLVGATSWFYEGKPIKPTLENLVNL
jgi:acyl-coenzyme A synthetase/AMP-(fatty) acid ligase